MNESKKYIFVGKTLFFPKEKILVIGDLHLGYEEALRNRGLDIPLNQFEEMISELTQVMDYIKVRYGKIEQVIFLGDIKHHFGYLASEKEEIKKLLSFLRTKNIEEKNIIFIRGNHEKNEKNGKLLDYYIVKDSAFIHGHKEIAEIYASEINLIVMAHLHPTITLSDKMNVKKEKYKCFLVGRFKKKDFVIVPSFLKITGGVSLSEFSDEIARGHDLSIIPQKELENFNVYVVSEAGIASKEGALNFGKLKKLR
ncbi:MAG: metallophosphoesterase [Nanoarchaeota archaeon]